METTEKYPCQTLLVQFKEDKKSDIGIKAQLGSINNNVTGLKVWKESGFSLASFSFVR